MVIERRHCQRLTRTGRRGVPLALALSLFCGMLLMATPARATNGMNMIGYGAVSSGMGGADLAVVDNASAMNINPAGICSCSGPQLTLGTSVLMPEIHHWSGAIDNDAEKNDFLLPMVTYVTPIPHTQFTVGFGAFAQGGMGVEFDHFTTPFMTRDELYSNVGYLKLTPTVGWQSRDTRLKLGAGVHLGQVNTDLKVFPATTVAGVFDGFEVKNLEADGYGVRLGFQYRIDDLVIGGSWLSETDLEFDEGDLVFASTPGVQYDAEMKGFNWPQRIGLGFVYNLRYDLRVAVDVDWIEWSQAIDTVVISAGPGSIMTKMDWDDQWVCAVGVEWASDHGWLLRLGYNHGDSPVPDRTVSPLFPAIVEDHATLGIGYHTVDWKFDIAYEHGFRNEQTNSLTGESVSHEQQVAHVMFTWLF